MKLRPIAPATFQDSIAANTRSFIVTDRFRFPFFIVRFRPSFALNTQRNLRVRFWISETDPTLETDNTGVLAEGPSGINLMGDYGVQDYIVGDGEEGEKDVPVNRWFPDGKRIIIDCHNLDSSNPHTLDVVADLLDATPMLRGETLRGAA